MLYFGALFNKTIIPLALVGYEMIIASQLGAMPLVGYLPFGDFIFSFLGNFECVDIFYFYFSELLVVVDVLE